MKIPTVNENLIKIILINLTIIIILPFNLLLDDLGLKLDLVTFQIFFSYLFFFLISSIISIFLFYFSFGSTASKFYVYFTFDI